jgi:hypothetical protein
MVNENSSILSLLLLVFPILSANVCVIVYLDLFYAGSTHLHLIQDMRMQARPSALCLGYGL